MTREVTLSLPLATGTVVKLDLCNKYAVPFYNTTKELTLGADGEITTTLTVNDEDTCWRVQELAHNGVFWVYGEDGVQSVDLSVKQYPREYLPSFLGTSDETLGLNAEYSLQRDYCGETLVPEEEQRLWCRYAQSIEENGKDDTEMCHVDNLLYERYKNG